ncbi:MAG: signal peptide peptidase SppA [Planctomycetota bacterium]|jgi:protease-4
MEKKNVVMICIMALCLCVGPGLVHSSEAVTENQELQEPKKELAEDVIVGSEAPAVIAHFHLRGTLREKPVEDPFGFLSQQVTSLKDLLRRLERARDDDSVKAVVLTFDRMMLGFGQLEEIRGALKELKDANKRVFVHAEGMSTGVYALLCAASDLSVTPRSSLWLTGLYGESIYLKGLLDKIAVEADFLQMGDYKSAAEMFTRTSPSKAAEDNVNWLLDGFYDSMVKMICESRGLTPKKARQLVDDGPYLAERALESGLINTVAYRDAFLGNIKTELGQNVLINNRYGEEKERLIDFSNPFAIFSVFANLARKYQKPSKDIIAVVYVEGMILPGHAEPSPFGSPDWACSGDIRKALEKAANDESVKAVVMRVDSPGGSAEASEVIWNAARQAKAKKPLVVSMGNVAGSGGYYVSCGADAIFANGTTITASIGVVGGKFVTTEMWNKLGVNWVGYKRGANADLLSSARRFDEGQRARINDLMEKIYKVFKDHIIEARSDKLAKPIEELAGGRVYTGRQALELGLVDRIGGLSDAVEYAAAKASISDYDVRVVPEPKDFFTAILEEMSGRGERTTDISTRTGERLVNLNSPMLSSVLGLLGRLDPQRAGALRRALERTELIHREGVALVMPEEFIIY